MRRRRILLAGLGALAFAGCAAGPATARITLLDDDAATISAALAASPGGQGGLRLDDAVFQLPTIPPVLPATRQVARVSGATQSGTAPLLIGRGPAGMAELLGDRVRSSGAHRVLIDDLGPAFAGQEGADLAAALLLLSKERPSYARSGLSRRVDVYVSDPGTVLADPALAGARTALARSGGVWLKAFAGETTWQPSEWLAWPAEAVAQLAAAGTSTSRVHVVFPGGTAQAAAWTLAREGSACAVLGNGPGAYRLGADVRDFVAEYRSTFPAPSSAKQPPAGCTGAPSLGAEGAAGLEAAAGMEASGLEIPEGGLFTPPLSAGEPAQLVLQLGPDPLGLAAALGIPSEAFWSAAHATVQVRGPGIATEVRVEGDGAARIEFTPSAPGPVTMRLVLDREALARALGGEPEVVGPLHLAGADPGLIRRVVSDPVGWSLDVPLVNAGGAPGSPVLEIVPPPA